MEQEEIASKKERIEKTLDTRGTEFITDQVLLLLELFSEELKATVPDLNSLREVEVIGKLNGFINSLDPTIQVYQQPTLATEKTLRPDFVLSKHDEKVILELKRPGFSERNIEYSKEQMRAYLAAGICRSGIIYLPPGGAEDEMGVTRMEMQVGNEVALLHIVAPKQN